MRRYASKKLVKKKTVTKRRTRSEIGRGSIKKGKGFEAKIAQEVSKALFPFEPERIRRVPQSGDFDKRVVCGDLMDVFDNNFPFAFEVKNRQEWSFDAIIAGKCDVFWGYWKQAEDDVNTWKLTNDSEKIPTVIFKKNYSPIYIMIKPQSSVSSMLPSPAVILEHDKNTFHIHYFSVFLEKLPDIYKKIYKSK